MSKRDKFDKAKWEGFTAETDTVPLINDPVGKPILLRRFQFKIDPSFEGKYPSKKEIADGYQKYIESFLWKDELKLIDTLRVIIDKEKKVFEIFAPCQPRPGSHFEMKPKTLQEIFKPKKDDSTAN